MAEKLTQRIARLLGITAPTKHVRLYASARPSRMSVNFGTSNASADAALAAGLTNLRQRSRQMVRDSAYAKRAKVIVQNNVVGAGIGLQAQAMTTRVDLNTRVNDGIEQAWAEWSRAENCHTGGGLHFNDLERLAIGEVFEAGEILIRKHLRRFGTSPVPFGLEVLEPERLIDDQSAPVPQARGRVRMGVELDDFNRPIAYYIRQHPGDTRWGVLLDNRVERVPADQIIHLRLIDRWPQTRGEPWLHTVLRKLDDMTEYSAAEVQAARASSYFFGTIETPQGDNPLSTETDEASGQQALDIESGLVQQLAPGESLKFHSPNRPNQALDPFMRYMLREVAAGCGVSYESISRDYSQSNYSSSRLALLDDRDLWRVLQQWWIRSFREPLHREWLRIAVLAGAIPAIPIDAFMVDTARYEAVKWKPRGWSWVDPTKEVNAYKEAIKGGLTTITDVIAQTADGRDIEDVIATRKRELELFEEADINVDTAVEEPQAASDAAGSHKPGEPGSTPGPATEDDGQDAAARLRVVKQTR